MRRKEVEIKDKSRMEEVLRSTDIGYLAFNGPDGWPRITALNFVYDGRILWHGAVAGERFECLKKDPRATFAAVSLQRYLPSYLLSDKDAGSATIAFKSVIVRGHCMPVEDVQEKCAVLNGLMEKYQPEGRYEKMTTENPLYRKCLLTTGIYALVTEEMTGKFKFGQNKSEEDRKKIAARLKEGGSPLDLLVAQEMLKTIL